MHLPTSSSHVFGIFLFSNVLVDQLQAVVYLLTGTPRGDSLWQAQFMECF